MNNLNERITLVEARGIIEIVSTLAKTLAFTKLEAMKILMVCEECFDRLERKGGCDE